MLTIAKDAMQLVLCQERQPVDTILLVLTQLCVDLDRDLVLLHLASVEKLRQELALFIPTAKEIF